MAIPTSGTYTFSIYMLQDWSGASTSAGNRARYTLGAGNNKIYQNISITFNNNTLNFIDSSGKQHTLTYNTSNVCGQGEYKYDSVLMQSESNKDIYWILSNEPTNAFNNTTVDHNTDNTRYWYVGPRTYDKNTSTENAFASVVCFLADTQISTPNGKISIQNLSPGDFIYTFNDNIPEIDTVRWVGKSHHFVKAGLPNDDAGYPIRISKNALGENAPYKDLLITAEHCLYFDGKFIPARMLVNNRTICYDQSFQSYEYYHIETEKHSIIMADGIYTESYLDTGNRFAFKKTNNIYYLNPPIHSWEKDSAAPLTVDRKTVEPIYRALEQRAKELNIQSKIIPTPLTTNKNLHLITDCGRIIYPTRSINEQFLFMIPKDTKKIRIISNSSRPCDTIGSFIDDRRQLGVLIGKIELNDNMQNVHLNEHLTTKNLLGWYDIDNPNMRWTNGNAELNLPAETKNNISLLSIEILASGPYLASAYEKNECVSY